MRFLPSVVCALFAVGLAFETEARADSDEDSRGKVMVAVDADLAFSAAPRVIATGVGVGGRLGYRLRVPLVAFTPELGVDYHSFRGDTAGTGIIRGFGGARLALGEIVKPSVFAHIGYADATGYARYAGLTYDFGVALDLTVLPLFDIGIHGDYASVAGSNGSVGAASWIDLGAHVALYF